MAPRRILIEPAFRPSVGRAALAFAAIAWVALPGCRRVDNVQTDLLERELRQQEAYIYELEDYLMEYSEKLRQARMASCQVVPGSTTTSEPSSSGARRIIQPSLAEDAPQRAAPKPAASPAAQPATRSSARPAANSNPPAANSEPGAEPVQEDEVLPLDEPPEAPDLQDMEAPELEIGPTGNAPPRPLGRNIAHSPPAGAIPAVTTIPDPAAFEHPQPLVGDESSELPRLAVAEVGPPVATDPNSQRINEGPALAPAQSVENHRLVAEQLVIRRLFAQRDAEGKLASLLAVVEAQTAAGEPVDVKGSASLMVMTGDAPGSLHRIERWDFTADESGSAWQTSELGDGLHLELPLGGELLPTGRLEMWARVVTNDGQKLLARAPFEAAALTSLDLGPPIDPETQPARYAGDPGTDSVAQASVQAQPLSSATVSTSAPTAVWRRASTPLGPRTEGYATTSSPLPGSGWTAQRRQPSGASVTR